MNDMNWFRASLLTLGLSVVVLAGWAAGCAPIKGVGNDQNVKPEQNSHTNITGPAKNSGNNKQETTTIQGVHPLWLVMAYVAHVIIDLLKDLVIARRSVTKIEQVGTAVTQATKEIQP